MGLYNNFPYTNFHEMNLDWILKELKDLINEWAEFEGQYEGITASAESIPYSQGASVEVSGGDGQPFNFDFKIPTGKDLRVLSTIVKYGISQNSNVQPDTWYDNIPEIPQAYYLWSRVTLNFSDGTQSIFYSVSRNGLDGAGSVVSVNNISPDAQGNIALPLPQPSDNTPLMDTLYGSEGVSSLYSRADHQHLSDTTKLDKQSGSAVGDKNAYVVTDLTNQGIMAISNTPAANAIAQYNSAGNLVTNEPTANNEAVRLADVRDNYVSNTTLANTLADYVENTDIATVNDLGIVKPDGSTINIDANGVLSAVPGGITLTLLYTNSTAGSGMAANTKVTIDTTPYKAFLIEYYVVTDIAQSSWRIKTMLIPNEYEAYQMNAAYGHGVSTRNITDIDSTGITFAIGYYLSPSTSTSVEFSQACVPYKIYGIK